MPTSIIKLDKDFLRNFGIQNAVEVGGGSQKTVYCVNRNGKECILKIFKNKLNKRDLKELKLYEEFKHIQGIPKIISVEEHDGELIVFEELIPGKTLEAVKAEYIKNHRNISKLINEICKIMEPIWLGDKVHRDLKPGNIIIQPDGSPVVIDFGIAKDLAAESITDTGFIPHTLHFAAPEQVLAKKDQVSYRTDFFGLGVIAYYLYHQQLPFAQTGEEIFKKIKEKNLDYPIDEECPLKPFFQSTLCFSPSERSRNVPILLSNLPK